MHPTDRADVRALQRAQDLAQDLAQRLKTQLIDTLEGDPAQEAARELYRRIEQALQLTPQPQTQTPPRTDTPAPVHVAPYSTAPRVALLQVWGDDLTPVEAARVSVGTFTATTTATATTPGTPPPSPVDLTAQTRAPLTEREEARADKLRGYLWKHRHTTPYEHAGATFALSVPLFVARQVMRHRTLSFNEISRRYTSEGLEIWTPTPEHMRPQHTRALQCSREGEQVERAAELSAKMEAHAHASAALYEELLAAGLAREVARAVLPCSTFTRFYLSGNLLNLARFLRLRLDSHAQPEAQEVARDMLDALTPHFPKTCALIFESTEDKGGPL